jgi:hypothetical protein
MIRFSIHGLQAVVLIEMLALHALSDPQGPLGQEGHRLRLKRKKCLLCHPLKQLPPDQHAAKVCDSLDCLKKYLYKSIS